MSEGRVLLRVQEERRASARRPNADVAEQQIKHVMKRKLLWSSGNVFVDLGFDSSEAAVLQMRVNLMSDLCLYIGKHKLTQSQAAKRLGIAQSYVSDLVRGKWEKFNLEMLIALEARLGRKVRVEFAA